MNYEDQYSESEYEQDEEQYENEDDPAVYDLTGIFGSEDEAVPVDFSDSPREERRKGSKDRRASLFTDRRKSDRRRAARSSKTSKNGSHSIDPMNIYLTFYCRKLRDDIQIITRSVEERTVSKLHRAGADVVMSYATMGANAILNFLQPDDVSVFTEGLTVFSRTVHPDLAGKSLADNQIRAKTGCSVIAINSEGKQIVSPDPASPLKENDELILIGTTDAEKRYLEAF